MRRLNVRAAQIDECIQKSMFAFSFKPQNPELQPGELLLLQLVKTEATQLGKLHSRIDFALVFDHIEPDNDGTISHLHWPKENRVWPWIVYGSATVPAIPFSLVEQKVPRNFHSPFNFSVGVGPSLLTIKHVVLGKLIRRMIFSGQQSEF